eukprot:TRINITY_DN1119_c0_g5_i2.p1 TRINITY_DN1119_c0_g5~~TRINITY_DN1119_c0_g5_i2.p1  ORF type:complete len:239 (-),score=50.01 TRINITY_DN1119_c0_g5_i2:27-743(-)
MDWSIQHTNNNGSETVDFCMRILNNIMEDKDSWAFLEPVDPVGLQLPDYFDVIRRPMDLGTIKKNMQNEKLRNVFEFERDINRVWTNAMHYNREDATVYILAKKYQSQCHRLFSEGIQHLKNLEFSYNSKEVNQKLKNLAVLGMKWDGDRIPLPRSYNEISMIPYSKDSYIRVGTMLNKLPPKYVVGVVQIVEESLPHLFSGDIQGIELDLQMMNPLTVKLIELYVYDCFAMESYFSA